MLGNIFDRFNGFLVFGQSITAYNVASSSQCLEVVHDTIHNVLAIYIEDQGWLLYFAEPFVTFSAPSEIRFRGFVGVCTAENSIYANIIFDYVLQFANNIESET